MMSSNGNCSTAHCIHLETSGNSSTSNLLIALYRCYCVLYVCVHQGHSDHAQQYIIYNSTCSPSTTQEDINQAMQVKIDTQSSILRLVHIVVIKHFIQASQATQKQQFSLASLSLSRSRKTEYLNILPRWYHYCSISAIAQSSVLSFTILVDNLEV